MTITLDPPTVVTTLARHMPAPELAYALGAVLPHAGKDSTLPILTTVRVEWDGETLTIVATDRYTLGMAEIGTVAGNDRRMGTVTVDAEPFGVNISRADAADLVKLVKPRGEWTRLSVGPGGALLVEGFYLERTLPTVEGEFPRFRSVIPTADSARDVGTIALKVDQLAKLAKASTRDLPMRFTFHGEHRPVVGRIDSDGVALTVVIMPVRVS